MDRTGLCCCGDIEMWVVTNCTIFEVSRIVIVDSVIGTGDRTTFGVQVKVILDALSEF